MWATIWLGIVLKSWVIASGWFYWDDYVNQARAWGMPLSSDYLLGDPGAAFMPAGLLLQWVLTRLFPMNFAVLATVLILAQSLALVLFGRLLLRHFNRSRLLVLPVVGLSLGTLTLPSATWWTAALNLLPFQIAVTIAADHHLRWIRRGRRRNAVVSVVAWVTALLFVDEAVLIPAALLGLTVVVDLSRSWGRALAHTLRRHWPVWTTYLVIGLGYLVSYRLITDRGLQLPYDWAVAADIFSRGLITGLLPSLAGGPWAWSAVGYGSALAEPPIALVVLVAQLSAMAILATCWAVPRARRAWAFAGGYVVISLGLTVFTRVTAGVDPMVVMGFRLLADAAVPVGLATALALVPLRGEQISNRARRVRTWALGHRSWVLPTAAGAVLAVVLGSVVSTMAYQTIWQANPSRAFIHTVTGQLATRPIDVAILDQPVPENVIDGLAYPYNMASWTLAPIRNRPGFVTMTSDLAKISQDGTIVPAFVEGIVAEPGPTSDCGWRAGPGSTYVLLSEEMPPFEYTVRLGYLASKDSVIEMSLQSVGAPTYQIPIQRGLHAVYLTMEGGGRYLKISAPADGAVLCTNDVVVGEISVFPSTDPAGRTP